MPNWCLNELIITGSKPDLDAFKQQAIGYSPWFNEEERNSRNPDPLNFHSLFPIPDEIMKIGYHEAGYDWERAHWGCKWGACHAEMVDLTDQQLLYQFDTAWTPPEPFVEAVSRRYPKLKFYLHYEEGGEDFEGESVFENGVVQEVH